MLESEESSQLGCAGVVIGVDVSGANECIVKLDGSGAVCVLSGHCLGKLAQQVVA